ncbi:hypothetical protein LMH77_24365 [Vibrio lentus]|uniref:helix-turn-helix domain-containing protein n=1 Tax=Vibrio lentus TaxID=136468 RepID=UPI001E369C0C|nr:hypothetical protein [Vibrio lentus]MCC4786045.1 hypothetical protein [Vibrio lentus]
MNLSKIKHPSLKLTDLLPFLIFIVGTGFAIGYEFVSPSPEKGLLNSALYMAFVVAIFSLCIEKDNSRCLRKRLDIEVEENRKATAEPVKYPITQKLIRDARLRSGLQQKDFISQNNLEITQATFSSWETGQAQVPIDVLLKLGLAREAIVQ